MLLRMNDPASLNAPPPPMTMPKPNVDSQVPSSAWMSLILDDPLAQSTNLDAWSSHSSVLDPTAEFWALNSEFNLQPHCMGFFSDDWGMSYIRTQAPLVLTNFVCLPPLYLVV
ncbi:hypothetical protein PENANT_c005G06086 [Penicillium antarcticum]|uniref:Uncharacterized protein n=1 Tax=Penicillium antarcticum TaxID=416450 RepID=A0A1V6QF33_9EURO|nr:hypothetical protein PENANT_c005G06086 [Penicillium antarcticum]